MERGKMLGFSPLSKIAILERGWGEAEPKYHLTPKPPLQSTGEGENTGVELMHD
jgi:hypothetical protein